MSSPTSSSAVMDATTKDAATAAKKAADAAAAKAQEEAAAREAAAKEQALALETARARVRAAAAFLEQERAAAAALERAIPEGEEPRPKPPPQQPTMEEEAAYFEASTVANLHAQASSVQNIRALVPIVLDPLCTQYNKWRGHMTLTLRRYALSDHVLEDAIFPDVPSWVCMDSVVVSWLFNTIMSELMEFVDDRHRGDCALRLARHQAPIPRQS